MHCQKVMCHVYFHLSMILQVNLFAVLFANKYILSLFKLQQRISFDKMLKYEPKVLIFIHIYGSPSGSWWGNVFFFKSSLAVPGNTLLFPCNSPNPNHRTSLSISGYHD